MIRKILKKFSLNDNPMHSIGAAALVVAASSVASRFLGLIRDRILASKYGAGDVLDIYYASFRIPDLVFGFLVLAALSAAFIPVFTGLITKHKRKEAQDLANGILNLEVVAIICISIILCALTPQIMNVITPGFSGEKLEQVIVFTRLMFLSPLFLGISAVFGSILMSLKRFIAYALAPIFYNVGIIIGALFLVEIFGPVGLVLGVLLGGLMHMLIQFSAATAAGFKFKVDFKNTFLNKNVRKVVRLMIPRTLGAAANQINLLIVTIFASTLTAGSLAVFHFANNLQSVVLGLTGLPFAIAVFPTLSSLVAKKEESEFVRIFFKTLKRIIYFVIPLSILFIFLRSQIVRMVLGSGKFDWEDTQLTFDVLGILAVSLFAQALIPLLVRSFYSLHDTRTPFFIVLFSELVNVSLILLLIDKYEILALALAFTVASIINMTLLWIVLRRRFRKFSVPDIVDFVIKILFASSVLAITIQLSKHLVGMFLVMDRFINLFIQFVFSGTTGMAVYIAICHFLKVSELDELKDRLFKKFLG